MKRWLITKDTDFDPHEVEEFVPQYKSISIVARNTCKSRVPAVKLNKE